MEGQVFGALSFAAGLFRRRYEAMDLTLAVEIARRAGLAIEHARLYAAEQRARLAREDLLAIVSHDLRNPLGVVMMSASKLLKHARG